MPISSPGLPVTLVLGGRACLVVGGGPVAARKARALLASGAVVTMVAPLFAPAAAALDVADEQRNYSPGEAIQYYLVIAATGVAAVDTEVFADANGAGILVNCADDPEHCTFILPAVHRSGPVTVAVSTDGVSPALASYLRDQLATELGEEIAVLARQLGRARGLLHEAGAASEGRDWRVLIDSLRASADAEQTLSDWVAQQLDETRRL